MSEDMIHISDFPDEIITNILSRFPVKSILQFRCVSKHWEHLISDPNFKKSHLKKAETLLLSNHRILIPTSPLLSLDYNASPDDTNSLVQLDFLLINSVKTLGSCNGLVCLIDGKNEITIFNPATRRHFKLSQSHQQASNRVDYVYGFGCSSNPNDVRLVRFPRYACDSEHVEFKSYDFIDTIGTFFNGFLHWLAYYSNENGNRVIASFDVSKETFKDILLPPKKAYDSFYMLGVINGCLSALCEGVPLLNAELWLMKEYGVVNSWSKFVKIEIDMGNGGIRFVRPLGSVNEDEILLETFFQSYMTYSKKQNMFRQVKSVLNQRWSGDAVVYVETLLSPQALCVFY